MIDIPTTSSRLRSVSFFIPALFGEVFYPNLKGFVWRRLPAGEGRGGAYVGVPRRVHQYGGRKVAETAVTEFCH